MLTVAWLQAGDIDAAVKFLSGLGKTASGLLGHSKSGSSVLLYASKYGQIPRVVCVSGRYDHKRGEHLALLLWSF